MKEIKGKKYYVSLGYIEKEKIVNGVNAKDIENIFMPPMNSVMYVDNTDVENVVAFPLLPVNDIQKKDGNFKFNIILNPNNIVFKSEELKRKLNISGLFEVSTENNMQIIKNIGFYDLSDLHGLWNNETKAINIIVSEKQILGE